MRIAVFSDIHGNPYACKAVLDRIASIGEFDEIIAAGDLCLGGSDPGLCLELLGDFGVSAVYGNTEKYILNPEEMPPDELHRSMWERVQPVAYWVRERLSNEQLQWLAGLPFGRRFNLGKSAQDELLVVHANPIDVELMIYPESAGQLKIWGEVRQPDDDQELLAAFENESAAMVVFGHFHLSHTRRWNERLLVDIAPCSMPSFDHDPRARFTVVEWVEDAWNVEQFLVEYEHMNEMQALVNSDMPSKADFLKYFD
jgi:predicted phosphodiesterase